MGPVLLLTRIESLAESSVRFGGKPGRGVEHSQGPEALIDSASRPFILLPLMKCLPLLTTYISDVYHRGLNVQYRPAEGCNCIHTISKRHITVEDGKADLLSRSYLPKQHNMQQGSASQHHISEARCIPSAGQEIDSLQRVAD